MADPGPSSSRKPFMIFEASVHSRPTRTALHLASRFKFHRFDVRSFGTYTARGHHGARFDECHGAVP